MSTRFTTKDLPDFFGSEDTLVFNNSRVVNRRLHVAVQRDADTVGTLDLVSLADSEGNPINHTRDGDSIYYIAACSEKIDFNQSTGDAHFVSQDSPNIYIDIIASGQQLSLVRISRSAKSESRGSDEPSLSNSIRQLLKPIVAQADGSTVQTEFAAVNGALVPPNTGLHMSNSLLRRLEPLMAVRLLFGVKMK